MAVGHTEEVDGDLAAAVLLQQCDAALGGETPQAGLLLAGHDLEFVPFLAAVRHAYPKLELIGCTTLAPLSSASGYSEGSTSLTLFASDVVDFTTGLGTDVAAGVDAAARQAVSEAAAKTAKDPALAIVTPTVEQIDPVAVGVELVDALGPKVTVFGGGAVPDFPVTSPWVGGVQIYGDQLVTDSLPLLLLSGPMHVSVGVRHGWTPVGATAVVTRSKGDQVYEIDGSPVVDFYRHYLGSAGEPAVAHPLAILDGDTGRYYLRAPLAWDEEEGAATFFGSVPEGSVVQIAMASTDEILQGAEASVRDAIDGFPESIRPEGALISACAVRNLLLGSKSSSELGTIRFELGPDVPFAGFYAYGEIASLGLEAPPQFHNETCVTVLIGT